MELTVGGVTTTTDGGDVYVIPPNVPHSGRTFDSTLHRAGHLLAAPERLPRRSSTARSQRPDT